jgi:hypothetical protein
MLSARVVAPLTIGHSAATSSMRREEGFSPSERLSPSARLNERTTGSALIAYLSCEWGLTSFRRRSSGRKNIDELLRIRFRCANEISPVLPPHFPTPPFSLCDSIFYKYRLSGLRCARRAVLKNLLGSDTITLPFLREARRVVYIIRGCLTGPQALQRVNAANNNRVPPFPSVS